MKIKNLLLTAALLSPVGCFATEQPTFRADHPDGIEIGIAFLPVILFLLILAITTFKLRNDKVKLSDLLSEKDPQMPAGVVAPVPAAQPGIPANPPVAAPANTQAPSQSVSRFIAFLTGLVALTIGICITTFYMYTFFGLNNPATKIDFSNLTNVIWGLGIGVLPYGFNKASSALKPNP